MHVLQPVELFRPHYSRIVADFCMAAATNIDKTPKTLSRVEIIELGGGRGTNANLILSYLEESHPEFYENLKYTLVDSSPSLHRLQKDVLEKTNHIDRVFFEQKDLMDVAEKK
jgi:SAM-dependent MidA family methyltransferase